jgi:hypothetical protein
VIDVYVGELLLHMGYVERCDRRRFVLTAAGRSAVHKHLPGAARK